MRPTTPILSLERIRRFRLEAGLSERALARATAMTSMSITALEEGRNHGELSLNHLVRVAAALNVAPAALFAPGRPQEPDADDVVLEAALAAANAPLRVEQIARGLGWSLDRVAAGLEQLASRLQGSGQHLTSQKGRVSLTAAANALSDAQQRAIEREHIHERGMTLALATVLRQAIDGRIDAGWHRSANAGQLLAEGSLLKLGFAEIKDGRLEPTDDVRFGLDTVETSRQKMRSQAS